MKERMKNVDLVFKWEMSKATRVDAAVNKPSTAIHQPTRRVPPPLFGTQR
jgi:hypothetical protein